MKNFLVQAFEKTKTFIFNNFSNDLSKMLLVTGTLGWIFSAAGQIFGIATNDKVSKEQKKFLIPQEMADAAINIVSFYVVTRTIQNATKKLASSGKIITADIKKFCVENGIKFEKVKGESTPDIGKAILDKVKQYQAVIDVNKNTEIKLNLIEPKIKELQEKIKDLNGFYDKTYAKFESGLGVIGNVTGAVLSSNIITPLLRNPLAAAKQKQAIAQEKLQAQNEAIAPYTPVLPYQNRVGIDDYKSKVLSGAGVKVSNGSMKI